MAYICPYKQHRKEKERPYLTADPPSPRFEGNQNPKSFESDSDRSSNDEQHWKKKRKPTQNLEFPIPPFEGNRNLRLYVSCIEWRPHKKQRKRKGSPSQMPELRDHQYDINYNQRRFESWRPQNQHWKEKGWTSQTRELSPPQHWRNYNQRRFESNKRWRPHKQQRKRKGSLSQTPELCDHQYDINYNQRGFESNIGWRPHEQQWKENWWTSQTQELSPPQHWRNYKQRRFESNICWSPHKQQRKRKRSSSQTPELRDHQYDINYNQRRFESNVAWRPQKQHWKEKGRTSQPREFPAMESERNRNTRPYESEIERSLHKQLPKEVGWPSQTPELHAPKSDRNLNLISFESYVDRSGTIVYAGHSINRWFAVGLDVVDQFPSYVHLEPTSLVEPNGCKTGKKPLILVNSYVGEDNNKLKEISSRSPWEIVADNVMQDIISSFESLRSEVEYQGSEKVKPTLVARIGKLLFHRSHSWRLGGIDKSQVSETILKELKRTMYANVPSLYMENIIDAVVLKIGFDFQQDKDRYLVKFSDSTRPAETVSCKCSVTEDKKLLLYKVELSQVRQMVVDISCLDKNLDMRLMLRTKTFLVSLTDDEMNSIRDLMKSAVLDSDVGGGLRWPQGMTTSEGRYSVIGVNHTVAKTYKSPSVRLKVRHADRFNFKSRTREATREVYLKLKGIISKLLDPGAGDDSVKEMLEDNLRLIWDHFLGCEPFWK